jgi:hypothetical protein
MAGLDPAIHSTLLHSLNLRMDYRSRSGKPRFARAVVVR